MNTLLRLASPLLLALLLLPACGDAEEEDEPAPSPGSLTVDTFEDAYAAALCDHAARCARSNPLFQLYETLLEGGEECPARVKRLSGDQSNFARARAGRTTFDPEAAAACVAAIRDQCVPPQLSRACERTFVGSFAEGDACTGDAECGDGSFCSSDGGDTFCDRRCAPRQQPGTTCREASACLSDDRHVGICDLADPNDGEGRCLMVLPHADAALGAPCGLLDYLDADLLKVQQTCSPGLWCQINNPAQKTGVCAEPLAEGATCTSPLDVCAGSNACADNLDTGERRCQPSLQPQAGGACGSGSGELRCNPLALQLCLEGTCQLAGDGSEGSRCSQALGAELFCTPGLACMDIGDDRIGTCHARLGEGVPCTDFSQCARGLTCDAGQPNPVCTANPAEAACYF